MISSDVLFQVLSGRCGDIGLVTLNRPDQLNALNQVMCVNIRAQLQQWAQLENIKAVVITGAGPKAFCAGGDIRSVYIAREQPAISAEFFAHEYRLDRDIYHFPKPYIAVLDGLTMGGGAGLSINGKYRIATEKLKLAMPETGIGFFTDVGASYFLSRCPGKIGWYLGLTGALINAADAQRIGLIDNICNSQDIAALLEALLQITWSDDDHARVAQTIESFTAPLIPANLPPYYSIIERCFSEPSLEQLLIALDEEASDWSQQTAQLLRQRSPTSLKVVWEQLHRATSLNFDACLQMEYRIARRFLATPDFYEGIRAAVIDKDRSPCWQPATLAEVNALDIAGYFAPLTDVTELTF